MATLAPSKPLELFFSYAHEDDEYRKRLETNLSMLKRKNVITEWSDREITAGSLWAGQIDERLNRAAIVLLLISPDFLASRYCYDIEMKRALERHNAKEARVVPVILRTSDWSDTDFSHLQVLPTGGKPVFTWEDKDAAFLDIKNGIEKVIAEINQTSVEHYASIVKRWGVFEGVGRQLTEEEVRHRPNTIRLYRHAGRVEKAQVVNGQLQLTGRHDVPNRSELTKQRLGGVTTTECQWLYIRDSEGNLAYELAKDQANRAVYTLHYSLSPDQKNVTAHYENEAGYPIVMTGSGAASVNFKRSDVGYDQEVHYYDRNGRRASDDNGSYGERRDLNEQGLAQHITNLGFDAQPAWRLDGYARFRFAFDELGNRIEAECLGLDGKPAWHTDGFSKVKCKFDQDGNQTEAAYYDGNDSLVRVKAGFAKWEAKFDDHGNQLEVTYFDEAGNSTKQADGSSKWKADYDTLGRTVSVTFLDGNDHPVRTRDGYTTWTAKYDDHDNQWEICFLDEGGNPVCNADGCATLTNGFDDLGRTLETKYWNEAGQRTRIKDGYSKEVNVFDGNNITEKRFFDELDQPARHKDGYAGWKATYDKNGKRLEWTFFDEAERPARCSDGYSKQTNLYNARGNVISETYFTEPAGNLTDQAAKAQANGLELSAQPKSSWFSHPATPVLHRAGYASWFADYNEQGQQTALTYGGTDDKPILLPAGNAGWAATYNDRGQKTDLTYLDTFGNPVVIKNGFVKWVAKYDEKGNRAAQTYFGTNDQPARNQDGVNTSLFKYDWRGNEVEVEYRDTAGQPMRHKDGFLKCLRTYNERDVIVTRTFLGFKDRSYYQVTQEYDDRGNVLACAFFDDKSQPALGEEGVAKWTATYDSNNHRLSQNFLDKGGHPAPSKGGYTSWTAQYDDYGREIDKVYAGLGSDHLGFFRKKTLFQDIERVIDIFFVDASGQLLQGPDGYARQTFKFDEKDNRILTNYDDRGNPVEVACFGAKNQAACHDEGWSRWTAKYDSQHNRIQEAYFGLDNKPTLVDGYAKWRMRFDEHGHEIELEFLDQMDRPTQHSDGYATRKIHYDGAGNPIEMWFFDLQDQPVEIRQGYASITATYDAHGDRLGVTYFDLASRPVTPNDAPPQGIGKAAAK